MNERWTRRGVLLGAGGAALGALAPTAAAWASPGYPERAVKLLVPWSAGGSTDLLARAVGQRMGDILGQPVVVDNRAGAAGRLGVDLMTKSPADGYTVALIELAHAIAPSIYPKMSYDIVNDTAAVSMLGDSPLVLFVSAGKYQEGQYQKFLGDVKKSPQSFPIATSGNGSISHLAVGLYAKETGVEFLPVPYKGSAPALTDVAAGLVAGHFCTLASASSLLSAGKIVPLMVTGNRRVPQLPHTPCAGELRLARMDFGQWWALVAPAKTPKPIIQALHGATTKALQDKSVQGRISSLAINLASRSPDDTMAFVRAESTKWSRVVADLGIQPE